MYQQGYRPPQQQKPPPNRGKNNLTLIWNGFTLIRKITLILSGFVLLLFVCTIINPAIAAVVFLIEIVAGVVIGIRAVRSKPNKPKTKYAPSNVPEAYQETPEAYQETPEAYRKPVLRDEIADLGYGHSISDDSEYIRGIRVAGVTFKNGRRHRQTILRQIYWKDEPYNHDVTVRLREAEYEGSTAIEVWTNDEQIGFVPKDLVPFIIERFDKAREIYDFEVSGGGKAADGSSISYGASFSIAFNR